MATKLKEYAGPASKWFPRKEGKEVPVVMAEEGGKCSVSFNNTVLVSAPAGDMAPGKVVFAFRKIAFTLQNLKISGKVDRKWCEAQLAALEKSGKLLLKPPQAPAKEGEAPPPEGEKGWKKDGEAKADDEKDL